jgi:hypothetical protein
VVNVSSAFKEKVFTTSRKTNARVTFEIIDSTAYDNVITVSDRSLFSREDQVSNRERTMSYKYGTMERNHWLMDGSFVIAPKPQDEAEDKAEVGWWSFWVSDAEGNFSTKPVVTVTFPEVHSSLGITVTFDTLTGETAKDFDVKIYDDAGAMIHQWFFANNSKPVVVLDQIYDNYKKVEITISKWSKGNHSARISEIDFGITQEYSGEKLIDMKVIEEMDLLGSTMPSNELQFKIDNFDRAFNIINPEGFYRFIQTGQEVKAYIGVKINEEEEETDIFEEILMGTFYMTEWKSDLGALTTTFTARDLITSLETKPDYVSAIVKPNLYDLAIDLFTHTGVTKYQLDSRLKDFASYGFLEPINPRVALQHIAIASQSTAYQDRNGVMIIKQFEPIQTSTGYMIFAGPDEYAGVTTPEVLVDYGYQAIDFDNLFAEPEIVLESAVKALIFDVHHTEEYATQVTIENPDLSANKGVTYQYQNPLIVTPVQAQQVANWMFLEYDFDAKYTAVWRQNPAFEVGEAVAIEDIYGGMKKVRITKQEFNFAGYLEGVTEGKGGV